MKNIMSEENKFYKKLKEWYGDYLDDKPIEVLHADCDSVSYVIKDETNIEIARVFLLSGKPQISIDCQADVSKLEGIKKLILFGQSLQ